MARQRIQYKLVGRYVKGNDTVYYGLISENGKEVRYTEEQMAFAVGRDQVINVKAQLYQDKVLFRGVDCDIKSLPTIQLNAGNTTTKTGTQPTSGNRTAVSDNDSNIIKGIKGKENITRNNGTVSEYKEEHTLSNEVISNISRKLNENISSNTYECVIKQLLDKYSNLAYNLDKTIRFEDMCANNSLLSRIIIVNHINNIWYIKVNIWEHNDYVKLAISETTMELIRYEYPSIFIKGIDSNINITQYKYCHYHELVIRLGAFSRIPQYKKLKLKFMKYNTEIFNNKIRHDLVLMVGEYKQGTHFDDLEGCAGYSMRSNIVYNIPIIIMKYKYFKSVDNIDNLDRSAFHILLHEMTHAYVDAIHGTNVETDPAYMGDILYGIDKVKYPVQYMHHGKKFGDAIKTVSEKTGLSFDELFSYGVHVNNTSRQTEYTKAFGFNAVDRNLYSDQRYTNSDYIVKLENVSHKTFDYKKAYENIKSALLSKQEELKALFMRKFNMQIIFNITADESRVSTIDSIGVRRDYDMNFGKPAGANAKASVLLYRLLDSRSVMIHSEEIKSTPSSVLKKVLEKIYLDALTD